MGAVVTTPTLRLMINLWVITKSAPGNERGASMSENEIVILISHGTFVNVFYSNQTTLANSDNNSIWLFP